VKKENGKKEKTKERDNIKEDKEEEITKKITSQTMDLIEDIFHL
jgi:hypothetical protein